MQRLLAILLCAPSLTIAALAQSSAPASPPEFPRFELFGGYSFAHTPGNVSDAHSMNGWEGSFTGNVNRWFALSEDFSGHYGGRDIPAHDVTLTFNTPGFGPLPPIIEHLPAESISGSMYNVLAGPQFTYRFRHASLFAHGLVGGAVEQTRIALAAHTINVRLCSIVGSISHCTDHTETIPRLITCIPHNSLAWALGGGGEWMFTRNWGWRAQLDYLGNRAQSPFRSPVGIISPNSLPGFLPLLSQPNSIRNNLRLSTGLVFGFGKAGFGGAAAAPAASSSSPSGADSDSASPFGRFEAFGGYSYITPGSLRNGFDTSFAGNINRWFAIAEDFGGNYGGSTLPAIIELLPGPGGRVVFVTVPGLRLDESAYDLLAGPQFSYRMQHGKLFARGMAGGIFAQDTETFGQVCVGFSTCSAPRPPQKFSFGSRSLAWDFGGGGDWMLTRHWGWRVAQFDYLGIRDSIPGRSMVVNRLRASTGLLFAFGK